MMPPPDTDRHRATSRLVDAVVRTRANLEQGRREAARRFARDGDGQDGGRRKVAMLDRIREVHRTILAPLVESRQRLVHEVGTVWLEEDIDLVHEMPRAVIHFNSRDSGVDAPRAYMTVHVGEDGMTTVSQNFVTPIKTTDVTNRRLERLDHNAFATLVDEFLAKAMQG